VRTLEVAISGPASCRSFPPSSSFSPSWSAPSSGPCSAGAS